MNDIHFNAIQHYRADDESFKPHKQRIKRRLGWSVLSVFLILPSLFLIFFTGAHLLSIATLFVSSGLFFYLQRLPAIQCIECSRPYLYFNVTQGTDILIFGVCHTCKVKMETGISSTSG